MKAVVRGVFRSPVSRVAGWLGCALFTLQGFVAHAEVVELQLPSKVAVTADYRAGDANKPTVILLHGFLQTSNFPTISRLVEGLSSEGYPVLAPTLSLGLTHRKQSMACEAIHTHTVANTAAELHAWVQWLKARKVKKIVLGGHSLGNVTNIAYLTSYPDSQINKFIGISIVEGRLKIGETERNTLIKNLRAEVQASKKGIVENQFSFCQKFRSTPESILSYLEWGPEKLLAGARKTSMPFTMIMGSKDDRLGPDWTDKLKKTRAKVIVIDGANHFMDGQHEFDLLDNVLAELKGV